MKLNFYTLPQVKKALCYVILAIGLLSGCGTTTGNSFVESEAFTSTFAAFDLGGLFGARRLEPQSGTITEFKMCVRKIRLSDEDDNSKKNSSGDEDIDFSAGLVDLTTGEAVSWGEVTVPVGFELAKVRIQLKRDDQLCPSFPYALKFNEHAVDNTINLKFKFDPPIEFNAGDTLQLSVQNIVSALLYSASQGNLNSGNLKDHAESVEDHAKKPR